MENNILDEVIEILTQQMLENYFKSKSKSEEQFIITKNDLYLFSIKLIKEIKKYKEEKR